MLVEVRIGDNKYTCKQGQCYSLDMYGYDLDEITHAQYRESIKGMTRLYDDMAGDCSRNIVYWYDDNGGGFFVKSTKSDDICR